ncbi:unnamed protein product [Jaminaea pallidilutea]
MTSPRASYSHAATSPGQQSRRTDHSSLPAPCRIQPMDSVLSSPVLPASKSNPKHPATKRPGHVAAYPGGTMTVSRYPSLEL